ncbi:plasmid protein [Acetobacter conturbans]|uniref:Plasmid protein n=1 Tax=Acetobacter conturbans TaxID=1737472 RepID=A0ABX0K6N1_9PROT|nr:plasmid protein [Acetobacter conturbans]NHN89840.1 plasmid protein [Acetobacter conturbans]
MSEKYTTMIEEIRRSVMFGCGTSYELFCVKFSRAVDYKAGSLPEGERRAFIAAAQAIGDYMTPDEERTLFLDYCSHGIEWGCCPAGCERLDADEDYDPTDEEREELHRQLLEEFAEEIEQERQAAIAARDARVLDMVDQIRARNAGSTFQG